MTHKFKSLLSFVIFLFLFSSCEKDFYEDIDLQKKQIKEIDIKTITYEDFSRKMQALKNKPAVKMIMNKANSSLTNHNARTGDDSDIEIYTDIIKEITSGTYKSYTMYIKTPDSLDNKIYNLTLEEKEGETAVFITKYSPTENWINNKDLPFEGGITTYRAEPTGGGSIKFADINDGGGGGGSNIYPYNCNGTVHTTIIVEPYQCGCSPSHWPWESCNCSSQPGFHTQYSYVCVPGITFPGSGGSNPGESSPAGGGSNSSTQPNDPSNNSLTTIVGEPIIRPSVLYLADLLSLNSRQITFLSNNPVVEAQISNYISENTDTNNVVNPVITAFAFEAINALIDGGKVDFVLQIILDSSFSNDQRLKFIWDKINNGNSTINNYLNNFRPEFSVAHLRFKNDVNFSSTFSQDYWNAGAVTVPPSNYIIDIIMNSDPNLESSTQNFPNIIVALEIIHETIHAEMFRKLMQCAGLPHVNFSNLSQQEWTNLLITLMNNFPGLHDYYLRFEYNTSNPSDSHHEIMAQHYISIMSAALRDFDNNNHNNDFYEALSWIGLMDTVAWNNLSQTDRNNITLIIQNAIQNESYTVDN